MLNRPRPIPLLCLLSAAAAALPILGGCGFAGKLPPNPQVEIPKLQLGSTTRRDVLGAYGQPLQKTPSELCYVGPAADALHLATNGWMALLTFDDDGKLIAQEYLRREQDYGYVVVDYWIHGQFKGRNRQNDADQLMLQHARALAAENPDYKITSDEEGLFALARVLPGENEPVVRWQFEQKRKDDDRALLTMQVKGLPGRDEPLLIRLEGAINQRSMQIRLDNDRQEHTIRQDWYDTTAR